MKLSLIVAVSENGCIGKDGDLPWRLPDDLKRFKALTMGKPIIMGRKTWESLPRKPLPGRMNIVITRQHGFVAVGADVVASVAEAVQLASDVPVICVIGGGEIYRQFLPLAARIYLTEIDLVAHGDTPAPQLDPGQWLEVSATAPAKGEKDSAAFVTRVLERRDMTPG